MLRRGNVTRRYRYAELAAYSGVYLAGILVDAEADREGLVGAMGWVWEGYPSPLPTGGGIWPGPCSEKKIEFFT